MKANMDPASKPELMGEWLKKNLPKKHSHPMEPGPASSIRELDYDGHHIKIETSYLIEFDGEPLACHIHIGHDGHAHTHSLPNYQWGSTVDLVRQMIDSFPDDFPKPGDPLPSKKKGSGEKGAGKKEDKKKKKKDRKAGKKGDRKKKDKKGRKNDKPASDKKTKKGKG
jgi:hypothetical protein